MFQNKMFCVNFLDSFYMLTKDKCPNVIIKLWNITQKVFSKVSYDDPRNKERIINVVRLMGESEKIKGSAKEIVDQTYIKLINQKIISSSDK